MGIFSSAMLHSWKEMGCLDNDNSEELEQLKAENDKLRTCLQEIKAIATRAFAVCDDDCGNANKFKEIIELTKAESEE